MTPLMTVRPIERNWPDAGITTIDSAIAELHRWVPDMAWDFDDPDAVNRAFRAAAKFVHPDAGGDATAFRRLSAARDLLIGLS